MPGVRFLAAQTLVHELLLNRDVPYSSIYDFFFSLTGLSKLSLMIKKPILSVQIHSPCICFMNPFFNRYSPHYTSFLIVLWRPAPKCDLFYAESVLEHRVRKYRLIRSQIINLNCLSISKYQLITAQRHIMLTPDPILRNDDSQLHILSFPLPFPSNSCAAHIFNITNQNIDSTRTFNQPNNDV